MSNIKVILDAFGGDNAPIEIIKGGILAQKEANINVIFCGDSTKIKEIGRSFKTDIKDSQIIHAPDVILSDAKPMEITKNKNCSMSVGLQALADNEADSFVSAGNSGALLVGTTLIVKKAPNIKRIAFAPLIPSLESMFLLVDAGANSDCTENMLVQFGIMGSDYVKKILKIETPRVGLLNIGTEETKGDDLRHNAYKLFKSQTVNPINFIGNVEANDIFFNACDVVVADGFTGNMILKTFEGTSSLLIQKINASLNHNLKTKFGSLLLKKQLNSITHQISYQLKGSAPLLGAAKPVFKTHGRSDAKTIKNALINASKYEI
ncbi:MAG: phosphate acyltransferase PlsX [Candidatus Improbicoccus devescovinae]|nr:MAG: phosphate acyltransferase PlsX [Candidatus Improbicoccus devescovinae]